MQVALELYLVEVVESEGTVSKSEPEYRLKLVVPFYGLKIWMYSHLEILKITPPKIKFCITRSITT